jgi:IclR family pca regulon transcriptional regulator
MKSSPPRAGVPPPDAVYAERTGPVREGVILPISREDRDFVQSLDRGLAVLQSFDAGHPTLSLRQAADAAGISRPAARRLLLTLEALGYLENNGSRYRLTTRVLALADAYLGSRSIHEIAQRHLESFASDVNESASLAMLDETEAVLVVRVPVVNRMRSFLLGMGERVPAYVTAQGRMLLAHLNDAALDRFFGEASLLPLTGRTLTDPTRLRAELKAIAKQGWALVDQEYEINMRAVAMPIRDHNGVVIASIGCMCHDSRVSLDRLTDEIVPRLRQAASDIEAELGARSEVASPTR